MALVESKAVAKRYRIFSCFDTDDNAQVIFGEHLTTALIEIDDRTIARSAETIGSRHGLFQQLRVEHQKYSLSGDRAALALTASTELGHRFRVTLRGQNVRSTT